MVDFFGDPDLKAARDKEAANYRTLRDGDGKHFIVACIGDQEVETKLVCEWPEGDDKAPCFDFGMGGCFIKYSWDNIRSDMMEKNPDISQLLEVKFPIGYRTEGHGDDFEDFIYSVRPRVPEGHTCLGHGHVSTDLIAVGAHKAGCDGGHGDSECSDE